MTELCGPYCNIYSIQLGNQGETEFEEFLRRMNSTHPAGVEEILKTLRSISNKTGARGKFFKKDEGVPGDGVSALYSDPGPGLRLYCIRYDEGLLVLGSGGNKIVRAWQDDPVLSEKVKRMIKASSALTHLIKEKELGYSDDSGDFVGRFEFEI